MRVAAIYDIHGNLPALEAVLQEIDRLGVDLIVLGGDVASGPMPRQTLDRLIALDDRARWIRGNGDREVVEAYDRPQPLAVGEAGSIAAIQAWTAAQITPDQRDVLAGLPDHVVLDVDGLGAVLFCHGSPRSDEEIITPATPETRLRAMLVGVEPKVVVCGHTHMQFEHRVDGTRVINAGSAGMPYESRPGAYWLLLGPDVRFMRTEYDVERAAALIRESGFPGAEEFAAENIIAPPSAEEATAVFERMAAERAE